MERIAEYYGRFQSVRGGVGGLPPWARSVLLVLAAPGIVLIALSILGMLVSILALLLLTVPAYRLLKTLTAGETPADLGDGDAPSLSRKRVEATVIE